MSETIILIPARLKATRLPDKPLADIHGQPMIVHVWQRAMEAEVGRVVVATDTQEMIAGRSTGPGAKPVMTRADHASGSDRIFEALQHRRPGAPGRPHRQSAGRSADAGAAAGEGLPGPARARRTSTSQRSPRSLPRLTSGPHRVSSRLSARRSPDTAQTLRALYFTRATAPHGEGPLYHHIGIYAYRRAALERFVALPPSPLELREKLEQLRALEAGMRIDVAVVDTVPLGVDTPADLERARQLLAHE